MQSITVCPSINKTTDRSRVNKQLGRKAKKKLLDTQWSCDLCRLKATCKEICPPMEYIIHQVEVEPAKELPQDNIDYERKPNKWPESPTTSENIFTMFFFDHERQIDIANKLFITQQYVSKVINKYKKILIKNLRK